MLPIGRGLFDFKAKKVGFRVKKVIFRSKITILRPKTLFLRYLGVIFLKKITQKFENLAKFWGKNV